MRSRGPGVRGSGVTVIANFLNIFLSLFSPLYFFILEFNAFTGAFKVEDWTVTHLAL